MASAQLYLDTRRAKVDGTFPVKIRIGYGRQAKLFNTIISLSKTDFERVVIGKGKLSDHLKAVKPKLDTLIKKANVVIEGLTPFNIETFTTRFFQRGNRLDLLFLLKEKADKLWELEKIGNSNLYKQAWTLLVEYHKHTSDSQELLIHTVNVKWLQNFETWVGRQTRVDKKGIILPKYSTTTLGMYLIRVRAIFNDTISDQLIPNNLYPFHTPQNNKGYKILKGGGNKRALQKNEMQRIFDYIPKTVNESFAKDIFMFSYLACGMNCIDIFRLKWSDIDGNKFTFIRKKTEGKLGGQNKITILLNKELSEIIERHGSHKLRSDLIFNVIPDDVNEVEALKAVRSSISTINQTLKKIAKALDITTEISTYFARHSFSTNQMNNETPLAFISKQLGHTSLKTTENYLSDFSNDKAEIYLSSLLENTN
ncbi:tyrosine-type recombinase/integrase [Pedobacter sp. LMG 31464]|uniref:Tyrosine-type recombinase/integrase n=1 Tax=Pedobacter planticolens TaxID=2679964 RepID=A0A923E297_9SPHI|nr:tyrosine-type recombinase/integrase [Pedobacter planticolens]MBB2146915.1 tyrosine-type recombinase/integrase [Pedobacter planticolens]